MRITQERADKLLAKIDNYVKTKQDNIFDAFYHSDLDVFRDLIKAATMTPEEEASLAQKAKGAESKQDEASTTPLNWYDGV